jgi:hypothetical protein
MSALLTLFLATGGVLKNLYFAGAIQRGFGFFLAALALNLACRSDGMAGFIGVAAVAVIGAAFYPALAPLLLLFLALVLFLPKVSSVGRERLSILKRCILLGASAIFVGVTILPQVVAGRSYGERLSLTRAEAVFEEWGPKGRYTPGDRGVPVNLFSRTFSTISATLSARRIGKLKEYKDIRFPFLMRSIDNGSMVLLAVVVLSLVGLWRRGSIAFSREARVLALFFLASVVAFCLATLTFPLMYIPSRYIALGLIPITAVILPALCSFTVRALLGEARSVPLWILVYGGASIIALGWGDLTVKRMPELSGHTKLFNFIEHLPSGAVVASWPRGIAGALPLFTGRPVVVSEEGHQIFHLDVLEEMRRRTRAMIALYAATDSVPVRELRERYQVSYLLINRRHLIEVPEYFEPFGSEMRRAREGVRGRELYLKSLIARRTVFRDGEYMVVDISSE